MADRRRRRPKIANSDSECSEDENVVAAKREQKLSEGGKSCTSNDGSDEGSITEDNEDETGEDETEEGTEYEEEEDEEGQFKGRVNGERQSGDGQEQPESLDDDEDRKNPAYIPRRGAFYEHDTRISDDVDVDPKETARAQKKLWVDKGKWGHDRFVDTFQAPKSTEEIIAEYGYDIRAYDTPPDAPPKSFSRGRRDRNQSNKLGDFIDMGAGGDGYHNNRGGYPPRQRGGRGYRGDGGRYTYGQIRDGGDGRNYVNNQKQFDDKYDQDYPSHDSCNVDRQERNHGGYRDDKVERNHGGYHDSRMDRNRDGYHNDRSERNRGGFHDDRSERNRGGYHDNRPDSNRGGFRDNRPESNRGSYRDNRPERSRRGSSQEKYYDRGDGQEYDNRPSQPMNRGSRGGRGKVSTETPGEEDSRQSPQRNARQWTNSTRGSATRRGSGPSARGMARQPPQPQHPNTQASEYPPTTTAPPSRSSQDCRNVDRPTAEMTNADMTTETQDARQSKIGRGASTHSRGHPSQSHTARHNTGGTPSIMPPTTVASTKWSHTTVTSTAMKHDTAATTEPSGGTTQNRPKRYSSQRQRNAPEVVAYPEPVVTETQPPPAPMQAVPVPVQAVPAPHIVTSPPRPLRRPAPAYFQPVYATQPPTVFHPRADHSPPHTVASFPRQHPPHLLAYTIPGSSQMQSPPQIYSAVPAAMAPPPVSMATAQPTPIIAPQYIAGTPMLNYVQPGQPTPYQMTTGPPAAMQYPAPQQPQPQPQQPQPQQEAIHVRGGTVYFNPDVQQQLIPSRSPVRRVKVAIPIVNPEEVQSPTLYIQMGDSQQATYAPYYHLTTAEYEHYEDGEPLEYDESQDVTLGGATHRGADDPECYDRVESTSGDEESSQETQETGDTVSGELLQTSEETALTDNRTSTVHHLKETNDESESRCVNVNETETTKVAVVEEDVRTENEGDITEDKKDITERDITETHGDITEDKKDITERDITETHGDITEDKKDITENDITETHGDITEDKKDITKSDITETHGDITDVKIETEDIKQTSAEIAEDDILQSLDNVSKTSEEHTKTECDPVCADKVEENTKRESDPICTDRVDVTSESTDHDTDHVCEDHSCDSHANHSCDGDATSSAQEVASAENNSQDADEYELATSESYVVSTDKASVESETTKHEPDVARIDDITNSTEATEVAVLKGKELGDNLQQNKPSLVNTQSEVSTSNNEGESESMQIKTETKLEDTTDVSSETETRTTEAAEEVELEVSHDVEETTESFVDAEDGSGATHSDVVKEVTEVAAPTVDSSATCDMVEEETVPGGTGV